MASILYLALVFPILSVLFLLNVGEAQQSQTPHGLAFENPISLSPSAFDFFHPKGTVPPSDHIAPCADRTECAHISALSASSKARADPVPDTGGSVPAIADGRIGVGNVVAMVMGLAFMMLVAMGALYIIVRRRANSRKSNPIIKPDA